MTFSFLVIVEREYVDTHTLYSRWQAAIEVFEYVEYSYNRLRLRFVLDYMGSIEFEEAHADQLLVV